ncbi:MAG: hypothetical protein JW861_08700 [Bacteroidales bacterium]|nr:hypothetical protein [Bacteroidales bacterium]
MKRLCIFVLLALDVLAAPVVAQPPQSFKYQAVVRDASGQILSNQTFDFRISIRNGSPGGTIPYQETFIATTNEFGMVTLNIGTGTPLIGTFTDVDWSTDPKFMQVDYKVGAYYSQLGTTELLSVPYALYTDRSADAYWGLNGSDIFYSTGNVGIGTTNPQDKLHVWGGAIFRGSLAGIKISSGSTGGSVSFTDGSSNFTNLACYNGKTILGGNVGIGTYDPANQLVIKTSAAGDAFNILDNTGNYLFRLRHTGNNSGALYLYDGTNNNTVFLYGLGTSFINGGPLGLGSTSVTNAKLQIEGSGTYDAMMKINNTGTYGADFFMGSTNDNWGGGVNQNLFVMGHGVPSSANIDLSIKSNGYVGIGTPLPDAAMHIKGSDHPSSYLYLESSTGHDAGIKVFESTTEKWHIFNDYSLGGLRIQNAASQTVFFANQTGNVGIGTTSPVSRLDVRGNVTIRDEASGDIAVELGTGLDYAEGFNVVDKSDIGPGTVLCLDPDHPGHLRISNSCYDRKVAGIVAGANDLSSGISLGSGYHDFNVALAGRVYCNVDATSDGIEIGDLLTTSSLPGYAMKATDGEKAQGAVLGKAMENLPEGRMGQILVLVTLQ